MILFNHKNPVYMQSNPKGFVAAKPFHYSSLTSPPIIVILYV